MIETAIIQVTPDTIGVVYSEPASTIVVGTPDEIELRDVFQPLINEGWTFDGIIFPSADSFQYRFYRELTPARYHSIIGRYLKYPAMLDYRIDNG